MIKLILTLSISIFTYSCGTAESAVEEAQAVKAEKPLKGWTHELVNDYVEGCHTELKYGEGWSYRGSFHMCDCIVADILPFVITAMDAVTKLDRNLDGDNLIEILGQKNIEDCNQQSKIRFEANLGSSELGLIDTRLNSFYEIFN